jgi:hypothetical protein
MKKYDERIHKNNMRNPIETNNNKRKQSTSHGRDKLLLLTNQQAGRKKTSMYGNFNNNDSVKTLHRGYTDFPSSLSLVLYQQQIWILYQQHHQH